MNENHSQLLLAQDRRNFYQMLGLLVHTNSRQLKSVSSQALAQFDLALRTMVEQVEIERDARRVRAKPNLQRPNGNLTDSEKAAAAREELTAAQQRGIIERALIEKDQLPLIV